MTKRIFIHTCAYVVLGKIDFIIKESNSDHPNIKFTYELAENNKITSFDVLNRISFNEIETSIYRKKANTDIYINWNSHAPAQWKIWTLWNLITRAKNISSTERSFKPRNWTFENYVLQHWWYPKKCCK